MLLVQSTLLLLDDESFVWHDNASAGENIIGYKDGQIIRWLFGFTSFVL